MRKSKIPRLAMALFFCLSVFLLSGPNLFTGVLADTADSSGVSAPADGGINTDSTGGALPDGAATRPTNYATTLYNGVTYYIRNMHSNLYLDAKNGGTAVGTAIQQWTFNGTASQQWRLILRTDGSYRIMGVNSGIYLDVLYASTGNSVPFDLWNGDCPTDHFKILSNGNGTFRIMVESSNYTKAAVVQNGSTSAGAIVFQYSYNASENDEWYFEPVPTVSKGASGIAYTKTADGNGQTYYIRNKHSGLYLNAVGGATADNTKLQQYYFTGSASQKWQIVLSNDGEHDNIIGAGSRRTIGIVSYSNANGIDCVLLAGGSAQQRFAIMSIGDGSFKIMSAVSIYTKALAVQNASVDNGAKVFQYAMGSQQNDLWYLEPAPNPEVNQNARWNHMSTVNGVPRCDLLVNADGLADTYWGGESAVAAAINDWNSYSAGKMSLKTAIIANSNVDLYTYRNWPDRFGRSSYALTTIQDTAGHFFGDPDRSSPGYMFGTRIKYAYIYFNANLTPATSGAGPKGKNAATGKSYAGTQTMMHTAIIVHELGHCVNLGHQITSLQSIMYPFGDYYSWDNYDRPTAIDQNTLKAMYAQIYS